MKTLRLSAQQAQQFYGDKAPSQRAMELAQGVVLALEIIGAGVQQALLDASQPQSSSASLDARELGSALRDVHVASSERLAESELEFLFSNPALQTTATFTNCTLAVIKPHAVSGGMAGNIIDAILRLGFDISAMELFTLDKTAAEEFLEVYKGVLPEYFQLVEQFVAGPLIACEIRAAKERLVGADGEAVSVVQAFRAAVGPSDPEVAKHIRPRSLRAIFGQNKIKNALHCTDLEEDGVLESQFFHSILQQTIMPTTAAQQAAAQRR